MAARRHLKPTKKAPIGAQFEIWNMKFVRLR